MVKKNYDNTLSRFHTIPERNEWTDGQTDLLYTKYCHYDEINFIISISRVSMLTRERQYADAR